jgi:hypothetical protein
LGKDSNKEEKMAEGFNRNKSKKFSQQETELQKQKNMSLYAKFVTLGRENAAQGDLVEAERNFQYAEHYIRVSNWLQDFLDQAPKNNPARQAGSPAEKNDPFAQKNGRSEERPPSPSPSSSASALPDSLATLSPEEEDIFDESSLPSLFPAVEVSQGSDTTASSLVPKRPRRQSWRKKKGEV